MRAVKWFFKTPRRAVVSVVLGALVLAGTAAAAWIIFTGASGTAGGKFTTATTNTAVTMTPNVLDSNCSPGSTCTLNVLATNKANVAEQILAGNAQPAGAVTFTSTPSDCASHLSLNPAYAGQTIAAGASSAVTSLVDFVKVDSTLPNDCSAGSFTATLNLATSP